MILFLVGILEMIIMTIWTKVVTKTQVLASGFITVVNVMIWYYVLGTIVSNLDSFVLVIEYALGCAFGTMIGTYYFGRKEKKDREKRKLAKKTLVTASKNFRIETKLS